MKRIAFISSSLAGGGQERVTVNIANALACDGDYKVYIVTGAVESEEYYLNKKVKRYPILTSNVFKDFLNLRKFLKSHKIDVSIAMGLYPNFVSGMGNFAMKTKVIISERNAPAHDNISIKSKLFRFLFYRMADGYVFQTEGARSFYSKKIQKKGVIIENALKEDIPFKSNICKKEIVAVGRLNSQKNYPCLIKAFALVLKEAPEYILRIFGKGDDEDALKALCIKLGIEDKVKFEGFSDNVHEAIKDSDIYVLSSDFEGMPNALMEAMAMGFPCVSTNCPSGGPAKLINHGKNGILVPVNDSKKLAKAILSLINNKKLKLSVSKNAVHIRDDYSDAVILKKWKKLLNR